MTENEWMASEDVRVMLHFLRFSALGPAAESRGRKYRLFACALARQALNPDESEEGRGAVAVAERFADGQVSAEELAAARTAGVYGAARKTLLRSPRMAANDVCSVFAAVHASAVLRCIVGNPFRPLAVDPAVLTPTVTALAQATYEERLLPTGELEGDRLAVMSDALEEAGCDDPTVLGHLRSPGPRFRGCHVIDLLLRKR